MLRRIAADGTSPILIIIMFAIAVLRTVFHDVAMPGCAFMPMMGFIVAPIRFIPVVFMFRPLILADVTDNICFIIINMCTITVLLTVFCDIAVVFCAFMPMIEFIDGPLRGPAVIMRWTGITAGVAGKILFIIINMCTITVHLTFVSDVTIFCCAFVPVIEFISSPL